MQFAAIKCNQVLGVFWLVLRRNSFALRSAKEFLLSTNQTIEMHWNPSLESGVLVLALADFIVPYLSHSL